jgi:hypothetical protein
MLNHVTPEDIVNAASLIRTGKVGVYWWREESRRRPTSSCRPDRL